MMKLMAVIVCGSRDWTDADKVYRTLDGLLEGVDKLVVFEGGARGADSAAARWAKAREALGVVHHQVVARWAEEGKAAGFRRNERMLELLLTFSDRRVIAFKDGFDDTLERGGTEHMVKKARLAEVAVTLIAHAPTASDNGVEAVAP